MPRYPVLRTAWEISTPELTEKEVSMRRRNRDRGFTLIELLIVVTIILIIAAFTIPKITKSHIPAHEASAIASIKAINEAEMIYSSSHPDVGFHRRSGDAGRHGAGRRRADHR